MISFGTYGRKKNVETSKTIGTHMVFDHHAQKHVKHWAFEQHRNHMNS